MSVLAKGSFTVEMRPLSEADVVDGVGLGRMSLAKQFAGDLSATGRGEMLTALTPVKDSAGYVAIERVNGTLHGRAGSFVFQHTGTMSQGSQRLSISVVPDSATGALAGLAGDFRLQHRRRQASLRIRVLAAVDMTHLPAAYRHTPRSPFP